MRIIFAIALIVIANIGFAAVIPKTVALKKGEVLTAKFSQERHLKGFGSPIKSNGQFYLLPKKAVIWSTKSPFESRLTVNDKGILQTVGGRKTLRIPASKLPGLAMLQSIMEATLKGGWEQLESEFNTKPKFNGDKWSLSFKPNDAGQVSAIKNIELSGDAYVETIEIQRTNGDWDMIFLSQHSVVNVSTLPELKGYLR